MSKCPKCGGYNVDFDPYFQRPRCYTCMWIPPSFEVRNTNLYEPCGKCWGYHKLQYGHCVECDNKGKVLNPLGKEVAELIREIVQDKERVDVMDKRTQLLIKPRNGKYFVELWIAGVKSEKERRFDTEKEAIDEVERIMCGLRLRKQDLDD